MPFELNNLDNTCILRFMTNCGYETRFALFKDPSEHITQNIIKILWYSKEVGIG